MKKKIKVLLISQFFWPESFPINQIIKNFKEIKYTIITAKPNYPEGRIFQNYKKKGPIKENYYNHTIYHMPVIARGSGNSFKLFLNYLTFMLSSIYFGTKYIKKEKFDVIFVYNTSPITQILVGYYFKKIFKVKLVSWVQDIWPESVSATNHLKENFLFNIFRKFCHYIYNYNDILILQSKNFFKYFKKYKINIKKIYIPNSANIHLIKKTNRQHKLKKKFKYNFVYAGNIGQAQDFKNFEIFLDKLYKENKDIKFHLIGSGSYKRQLIRDIKKKKLKNIEIYSYVKNEYLYNYLREADVLFLSLKNNYIFNLTIPSKLQNYLYCKKPILAWANGSTKEIILKANCGIAVKPGNINDLVKGVLKLSNKQYLKKLGYNSKIFYKKNYELKSVKIKLLKTLNNLTS
jgi:glycosyltransferase involved in cell wall biosynthesis